MGVDRVQAFGLCDRDMIVANAHDRTVFLMSPMNPSEFPALSCPKGQPDVTEFGEYRPRHRPEAFVGGKVWKNVVAREPQRCEDSQKTLVAKDGHCDKFAVAIGQSCQRWC